MIRKNKKGFTLIEIIGTLVILTLVSLLVVPSIISVIGGSRENISDEQLRAIERSARVWLTNNLTWIDEERSICVGVDELVSGGYIENNKVVDPKTEEELKGYVIITYDTTAKKYLYTYDDDCSVDMARLRLEVASNTFNNNRWANKNIEVRVIGDKNTASYKWCQSTTGPCEPTTKVNSSNGTVSISQEGKNNYVCAKAIRATGEESATTCVGPYQMDKTPPVLTVPGDVTITSKVLNFNPMDGVSATDNFSSGSGIKIETSGNISLGLPGNYTITYRATDEAGNTTIKIRNIKIVLADDGTPTLAMSLAGTPLNALGWSKTNINVNINAYDTRTGIKSYTYCVSGSGICTPNTTVNAASGVATITTEGTTNYVCAYATNNNNIINDTTCVGPYKIDKTLPILNIPADVIISYRDTAFNLGTGVTYSDNLTPTGELSYQISGGLSFGIFGDYTITYRVTDLAGNVNAKTRSVIVGDDEAPVITLKVDQTSFNTNGWANKNVPVVVSTDDGDGIGVKSYTYCTTTSTTCTPSTVVNATNGSIAISSESATNYVCAIATDISNNVSNRVCIGPYKVDKTAPTLNLPGTLYLTNRDTTVNLMTGVSATDNLNATDDITISTIGSVSLGIFGEYIVTYTATDLSGNATTKTRSIVIGDSDAPTVTMTVDASQFNANGYSNKNITVLVSTDDGDGIGVKQFTYCTTTSTTCTPSTVVEGVSGDINFGTDSNTNYICITATDHSGNVSARKCNGPYKIDKIAPTLTVPDDSTISITASSFNIQTGVSYSDNITPTAQLIYTSTGSVSLGIAGSYPIEYTVTDLAGNTTTKSRTVQVFNDVPPTVTLTVAGSPFNGAGWANANFNINVATASQYGEVIDYSYCTALTNNCTPNTLVEASSGTITISTNSATNYVCVQATDDTGTTSTTTCVGPYKLDKVAPTCSVNLSGTMGSNSWYTGDVTVSTTRTDETAGISAYGLTTSSSVTYNSTASTTHNSNTTGITYYGYVQDAAGNTGSCSNSFKRDVSTPSISVAVSGSPFNAYSWASANFNVIATGSAGNPGVASVITCTSNAACTPGTTTSGSSATVTVSTERNNNYVCAYAIDNAGRTTSTSCVGPYALDKGNPSISHSGNVSFNTNTGSYDIWSGVSYSDGVSGVRTVWSSGSVSFGTAGTYTVTYYAEDYAGRQASTSRTFTITPATLPGGSEGSGSFANSSGYSRVYTNTMGSAPQYDYTISWSSASKNGNTFTINALKVTYTRVGTTYSYNSSRTDAGGCGSCTGWGGGMLSTSSGSTQMPASLSYNWGNQSCSSTSNTVQICVRWRSGNWAADKNEANLTRNFTF